MVPQEDKMYQICWFWRWSKVLFWYSVSLRTQEETELNSVQMERFLMKGRPTEVLAGSGESTRDAKNPGTGKSPILRQKIQWEKNAPGMRAQAQERRKGHWVGATILKRGSYHQRFFRVIFHTTCTDSGRGQEEIFQLLSPLLSDPLLIPSIGQNRSQLEGVSF